ncbi:27 kDa glycoprotein-like isoform X2 [Choristoneura fumiferana]|uniref:27 kDa glycoprotein-like isoform X2 n=1 Tax=Choristoneura fumiferana TaxID=7141 RepID=UPI003D154122
MVTKHLIIAVFLLGTAWAQLEKDPDLQNALNNIPPELEGKVTKEQFEEVQNKSAALFKDKCMRNGGANAFGNAEKAFLGLKSCVEGLVNRTELAKEIEEAKPVGKIDEVFKKYCNKKPQFKGCFKDTLDAVKPCFTADEQKNLNIINNVTEQLAEFVCFKDGDRIALFIAEGGPECMQDHQEAIQSCVNSTMGAGVAFDPNNMTADNLPDINFGEKECNQFSALQSCVVGKLESCAQPTTANIVEALFKYIRKGTPCKNFNEPSNQKSKPGSASGLAVTSLTLIMAAASLLIF